MNVLIDNHHGELTHSLELLFGKRLGFTVFYPIGEDWYEKDYWKVFPHPETAQQYLGFHRSDPAIHSRKEVMTVSGPEEPDKGLHYCWDPTKGVYQKAITFDHFLERRVDLLVSSLPAHIAPFQRLVKKYKPGAKHIFQMGNIFSDLSFSRVTNILNSTDRRVPFWIHSVKYSQEFELSIFKYSPPRISKLIVNFTHYMSEVDYFYRTRALLPEFTFESYGAGNETGSVTRTADVAQKMQAADFIWHLKKGGDGYGHVVHNAAALGRPLVISKKQYRGMRFEKFIEDGKTCVNVDGLTAEALAKKIRLYGEPDRLEKMGLTIYERFHNFVDFDRDEKNIRYFLKGLR